MVASAKDHNRSAILWQARLKPDFSLPKGD
jgi:hypothetical protein